MSEPPIACALSAPEQAARRTALLEELVPRIARRVELEDGVALHFPASSESFVQLAAFVDFESACCSFLRFELVVAPRAADLVLRVRGPAGAKEFLNDWLEPRASS